MEQRECVCLSHRTGKRAAQINLSFSGSRAELKVRDGHAWYTGDDRRVCKTHRQLLFWRSVQLPHPCKLFKNSVQIVCKPGENKNRCEDVHYSQKFGPVLECVRECVVFLSFSSLHLH